MRALTFLVLLATATACEQGESYTFAFLVDGSKPAAERTDDANQKGHLAHLQAMADKDELLVAGPFGDPRPDGGKVRGILVLATPSLKTAQAQVGADPSVAAGTLAMELVKFKGPKALKSAMVHERAMRAGKTLSVAETMRSYAMILAKDSDKAERALNGKVIFSGRLEGSPRASYVALLDVKDVAEAQRALGEVRDIGPHEVYLWWGTRSLAQIGK